MLNGWGSDSERRYLVSKVKCCKVVGRRVIGKEIKWLIFDLDLDSSQIIDV